MNHWTGRKHKPESIEKIRLAKTGVKQSEETIQKRALKIRGRKYSEEHKRKISESQKGEKGNNWKGERATYNSVHSWVRDTFGKPNKCEHCLGVFFGRKIHWANVSGQYSRERNDWIRLCAKCHRAFDKGNYSNNRLHSHA